MSNISIKESSLFIYMLLFSTFFQFDFYTFVNGSSIKLYHIIIPIIAMFIFIRGKLFIIKNDVLFFFILATAFSIYNFTLWGGGIIAFQAIACFLVYCIASDVGVRIDLSLLYNILFNILIVFTVSIMIKDIIYFKELSLVYSTNQEVLGRVYYFVGGGHNIEVTYLSLLTVFFLSNKRIFYILVIFIFILSLIYLSRVGIVEVIFLIYIRTSIFLRTAHKILFVIFGVGILSCLILEFNSITIINRVLHAFNEITVTENGRGMLWFVGFKLLENNLMGYGIGNSIVFAREYIGRNFIENNFHNVYLQYFLDMGIFPLIAYIYICFNRFFCNKLIEFRAFLILFFISSFFQFTGYDIIFWLFLGLRDGLFYQKKIMLPDGYVANSKVES